MIHTYPDQKMELSHSIENENPHFSILVSKHDSLKSAIKQYIEKCKVLEFDLQQKDSIINDFQTEKEKMQADIKSLENSNMDYQKKIKIIEQDKTWEKDQNIKGLQQNLGVAEAKIEELSNLLKAEKHFNMKITDNLAKQTQETSNLK